MKVDVGSTVLDHKVQTVHLNYEFNDPVVIMGTCSRNGGQPVTIRVRNVTPTSFDVVIQEWLYLDNWHLKETISWMVLEAGHYKD